MAKCKKLSLEQCIACHGGPTLAGLKCGNLLRYNVTDWEVFRVEFKNMQDCLQKKGVLLRILKEHTGACNWALIYVFRERDMKKLFYDTQIRDFMKEYGYSGSLDEVVHHLSNRVCTQDCFPHEIGVFLGYPLEDVKGFIRDKGAECSVCGLWKSYGDPKQAKAHFQKLERCMKIYKKAAIAGRSLEQLTVAS